MSRDALLPMEKWGSLLEPLLVRKVDNRQCVVNMRRKADSNPGEEPIEVKVHRLRNLMLL